MPPRWGQPSALKRMLHGHADIRLAVDQGPVAIKYSKAMRHSGRLRIASAIAILPAAAAPFAAASRIASLLFCPSFKVLRHVAHQDVDVEDVQAFGDKLHIRVSEGKAEDVLSRLQVQIGSEGGKVDELRVVKPVLEDVFIALSNSKGEVS